MRNISILSKKRQKNRRLRRASLRRRLRRATGASAPDPVYTRAMPHDLSRSRYNTVLSPGMHRSSAPRAQQPITDNVDVASQPSTSAASGSRVADAQLPGRK